MLIVWVALLEIATTKLEKRVAELEAEKAK